MSAADAIEQLLARQSTQFARAYRREQSVLRELLDELRATESSIR